jgi:hypothetical protein
MNASALRPVVALMIGLSGLCVALAIWEAISPFVPHEFYGVGFYSSGRVYNVYPGQVVPGARVSRGDSVIERPDGNPVRGYQLRVPVAGDTIHIATAQGTAVMRAAPATYPKRDALAASIRNATTAAVILFAALLFARRPGVMALALWLWAVSQLGGTDLDYALAWLPRTIGFLVSSLFLSLTYSGLALVSFALRFPSGDVSTLWRWLDRAAWIVLCCSAVAKVAQGTLYFAGRLGEGFYPYVNDNDVVGALPLLIAAGILLSKQLHAQPLDRPRIVWASTAFVGAAVMQAAAIVLSSLSVGLFGWDWLNTWRLNIGISNLLPLLAVYPILRYRLVDLGFVVSRATLYSALTLAAFGTLAAVNWLAQHFVTERLAFIMQPVAAIAIGLGYFRVRGWMQGAIERVLFRERVAAEAALEATIRGLPFVERAESVDEVLVSEVATTLRLGSAALFRLGDRGFERGLSVGWNDEMLDHFPRDDMLARRVLADGPTVRALIAAVGSRSAAGFAERSGRGARRRSARRLVGHRFLQPPRKRNGARTRRAATHSKRGCRCGGSVRNG